MRTKIKNSPYPQVRNFFVSPQLRMSQCIPLKSRLLFNGMNRKVILIVENMVEINLAKFANEDNTS